MTVMVIVTFERLNSEHFLGELWRFTDISHTDNTVHTLHLIPNWKAISFE